MVIRSIAHSRVPEILRNIMNAFNTTMPRCWRVGVCKTENNLGD